MLICNFHCQKKENFILHEGDLLFQDLDSSPLCEAIEQVTFGIDSLNFSHIGIITIIDQKHYVLEAFSNGVDTVSLDIFLNRSLNAENNPKVVVGRLKNEYKTLIPQAINFGIKLIGKNYDEEFIIDNDKFYCSELIYEIFYFANSNQDFFYLNPMTYKVKGTTLPIWEEYFENLNTTIPEGELGINPGAISLSEKISIIYSYQK